MNHYCSPTELKGEEEMNAFLHECTHHEWCHWLESRSRDKPKHRGSTSTSRVILPAGLPKPITKAPLQRQSKLQLTLRRAPPLTMAFK